MSNLIGVYDSGIGGLTVLKELVKAFPDEQFIYLGDNDNAPYGTKTLAELLKRAYACIDEILEYDVKAIVIACNTLTTMCFYELNSTYNVKLIGTTPNVPLSTSKKTLIIGTYNTLTKSQYQNLDPNIYTVAPLTALAGDIEMNIMNLKNVNVARYFTNLKGKYEQIVLGCTHYPFVAKQIKKIYKGAKIIDSSKMVVSELKSYLKSIENEIPQETCENENISQNNADTKEVIFIGNNKEKNKQVFNLFL